MLKESPRSNGSKKSDFNLLQHISTRAMCKKTFSRLQESSIFPDRRLSAFRLSETSPARLFHVPVDLGQKNLLCAHLAGRQVNTQGGREKTGLFIRRVRNVWMGLPHHDSLFTCDAHHASSAEDIWHWSNKSVLGEVEQCPKHWRGFQSLEHRLLTTVRRAWTMSNCFTGD